jgi:DNA-binding winged helix-turn-helix (wHTH) protein
METIGSWSFDAAAGTLRRGDSTKPLEDRSARVLEVLAWSKDSPLPLLAA